jgi:arylsulfatase A-like enzyme
VVATITRSGWGDHRDGHLGPGLQLHTANTCATIAEILKLNGYATAHVGKCHEVPVWETSPAGPFDRWPSPGNGFEYFYGFLGGETDQYYPTLREGITRVEPWGTPEEGYHLTEDLTDKAIAWIRQQKALTPNQPFFAYFAPGATHAPHQVPKEWADKYRGRFDHGWDRQRELTFARQKELGVIPQDAELTRRHDEIPAWDDMAEELKPILPRQSAEGTTQGTFNEMISLNGMGALETPEFMAERLDQWGGPESAPHYAVGWAHAMCAPYQWTKQVASHWGGTRNGTIVHWPAAIQAKGELRHQFHHVIDVAPTLLEAAGVPEPAQVNGITQRPIEGVSMAYSFDHADAPDRHQTQYFEIFGNRGIYHRGWSAITKHRTPWQTTGEVGIAFDDDTWELYDGSSDWTQARALDD